MRNKIIAMIAALSVATTAFCGCREVNRVTYNVSKEADNFNVIRRLSVINVRTDKPVFELVAAFSLQVDSSENQLEIICETGENQYKKHFIGLNEWTSYFVEDISGVSVDKYHYEVNFLPEMILPVTLTSND